MRDPVMPAGVDYPDGARLWTPPHWRVPDDPLAAGEDPSAQRGHTYMFVLGRLKPGVTSAQAQADITSVAAAAYPVWLATRLPIAATLRREVVS